MPYSVECEKCKRQVAIGASDHARTCNCGHTTHNQNHTPVVLYKIWALDGSKIEKKKITLADLLNPAVIASILDKSKKP